MTTDLKFALRSLAKAPGFTAVAVLTLALGIGACTAIFSVVDAVLLRPLDYRDPDQIVTLWSLNTRRGTRYQVSGPDFRDWRTQSRSFAALAKYYSGDDAIVANNHADKAVVASVSEDFFSVMGATPQVGRIFRDAEWSNGAGAVVSHEFARRYFDDAEKALGATVKIYGRALPVVGVMPVGFDFPNHAEVWLPIDTVFPENTQRSAHNYRAIGRLAPGVTLAQAQTELTGIARRLEQQFPDSNTHKGAAVVRLQDYLVRNHRATLWVMLGAVGVVLLIACTNVANLLLARGAGRAREVALRAALGASPWRIVRSLLAESAVLAAFAGATGILLAMAGVRALVALAPAGIPRLDQAGLDYPTLFFACFVSVAVCFLAGVAPAVQSLRVDLKTTVGAGGRAIAGGAGRMRSGLVVAQVALSLVLLTGAGLLLRSFQLLSAVDPGYRAEKVLVMQATFPTADDASAQQGAAFFSAVLRDTAALPGVVAVAAGGSLPVDDGGSNGYYSIESRADPAPAEASRQSAQWRLVAPAYFATLGIAVRHGREFDERDQLNSPATVVINEAMARAAWPGQDPIGHRIRIGWDSADAPWMTIVGVVADTKQTSLDAPVSQELYVPAAQHPRIAAEMKIIARTAGDPTALTESFRRIAHQRNAEVPVRFTTAEILIADTLTAPRFRALLVGVFATTALVLAVIGVAGVMACVVVERRKEIGIRLALGAQRHQVLGLVLGGGLRLVAFGLVLGLVIAAMASRLIQSMLFNVPALDPLVYGSVAALFAAIAAFACLLPARRATLVDPMIALRAE